MDEAEFQQFKKMHFQGGYPKRDKRRGHVQIVYALCDPRDGSVRYVGTTNNLLGRLNEHMRMYGGNERKNAWIKELKDAFLLPYVMTLEVAESEDEWREREIAWIDAYVKDGADLLNDEAYKYQEGA